MTLTKVRLRADILTRRRELSPGQLDAAAARIGEHLAGFLRSCRHGGDRGAGRIAAYVPIGAEPGSLAALDAAAAGGAEVLLPVLLDDGDLDWARYAGRAALAVGARGVPEPTGERLGRAVLAQSEVVVVPALAVDHTGHRLGRGGGSYDRALARVPAGVPVVALLHDGELVEAVPAEPHDRPVTHVITPTAGCRRVGPRWAGPARRAIACQPEAGTEMPTPPRVCPP